MSWKRSLVRAAALQLDPRELVAVAGELLPALLQRLPREERLTLMRQMVEVSVRSGLRDLTRQERVTLMNSLLPLLAQEFPLADLDLAQAFPAAIPPGRPAGPDPLR